MIISHAHQFIFVKTNKTAGTSVEIALSKFCGPDDVITPLSPPQDEETRRKLGYRGPQNYLAPLSDYGVRDWGRLALKGIRKRRFQSHVGARHILRFVDREVWDRYFKFCFERNPWDRLVSLYFWRCKSEPRPSLGEFLATDAPLLLKRKGRDLYTIDGKQVVDRVCRYENIAAELEAVRTRIGLPEPLALPHAKAAFRKGQRNYRDLYGPAERAKVAELFHDEIEQLGYEF